MLLTTKAIRVLQELATEVYGFAIVHVQTLDTAMKFGEDTIVGVEIEDKDGDTVLSISDPDAVFMALGALREKKKVRRGRLPDELKD